MSFLGQARLLHITTERESLEILRIGDFAVGTVELVELNEGQQYPPHVHDTSRAQLRMITGTGTIVLNGKSHPYEPGDAFDVPPGTAHGFAVTTQTIMLSVQSPPIHDVDTDTTDIRYLTE